MATATKPAGTAKTKARAPVRTATTKPTKRVTSKRTTRPVQEATPNRPVLRALEAAERAVGRNSVQVVLPVLGDLRLPAAEELAFLGGVGLLTVIGVLEWPVALLLGVGHGLATGRRNKALRSFGEALEEA
jgi:hypothetical protein